MLLRSQVETFYPQIICALHPATTTTYTLTGLDICYNRATVTVFVNPLPTVAGTGATMCMGNSATISATGARLCIQNLLLLLQGSCRKKKLIVEGRVVRPQVLREACLLTLLMKSK